MMGNDFSKFAIFEARFSRTLLSQFIEDTSLCDAPDDIISPATHISILKELLETDRPTVTTSALPGCTPLNKVSILSCVKA